MAAREQQVLLTCHETFVGVVCWIREPDTCVWDVCDFPRCVWCLLCVLRNAVVPRVRCTFISKRNQIYPTLFWSIFNETALDWKEAEKPPVEHVDTWARGVIERWGSGVHSVHPGCCTEMLPLNLLMERHSPAVIPGCATLSATDHIFTSSSLLAPIVAYLFAPNSINRLHTSGDLTPASVNSPHFKLQPRLLYSFHGDPPASAISSQFTFKRKRCSVCL